MAFTNRGIRIMKKLYIAGALLSSALVLAACNVQTNAGGGNASNAAAPAPAAPAAPAAPQGSAAPSAEVQGQAQQNFTVVNNTGHTVMTLNVSPSNEDSWGPDILGSSVLANGESAQVTFPRGEAQCSWDIKATYDDGDTTDARGVNLCQVATVTLTGGE
jgi:predicted small secreted protein